jgi:ABC-type oligopeptide transport system substrate-binding subunit
MSGTAMKLFAERSDFHFDDNTGAMDRDSEKVLREKFHSHGKLNIDGYANPRVDELIEKIKSANVTYARDAYLEEAWRIVTEDVVYLPMVVSRKWWKFEKAA